MVGTGTPLSLHDCEPRWKDMRSRLKERRCLMGIGHRMIEYLTITFGAHAPMCMHIPDIHYHTLLKILSIGSCQTLDYCLGELNECM